MSMSSKKPRNPINVLITTQFGLAKPPTMPVRRSRLRQAVRNLFSQVFRASGVQGFRGSGKTTALKPQAPNPEALITHHASRITNHGFPEIEVSICLCDDATIQTYNAQYRQVDEPTDVLSFPQEESVGDKTVWKCGGVEVWKRGNDPALPPPLHTSTPPYAFSFPRPFVLGDVLISLETAKRQAEQNHLPLEVEILMLCLHGVLHLLGYEDSTEADRRRMNQIAIRTLRSMGYTLEESWYSRHHDG